MLTVQLINPFALRWNSISAIVPVNTPQIDNRDNNNQFLNTKSGVGRPPHTNSNNNIHEERETFKQNPIRVLRKATATATATGRIIPVIPASLLLLPLQQQLIIVLCLLW